MTKRASLPEHSDSDAAATRGPGPRPKPLPGRPRLLLSACLLGEQVRYDGGHKRDPFLVDSLGRFVEWVRVCPEADCGLGIPRPAIHLVGDPERPRLVASRTGADHTARMESFSRARVEELAGEGLCGFVCKKDSPSCGMTRVKVYDERGGGARRVGAGIFTRAFVERFPQIPVEEEGRLHDPRLREWFVERIFALRRWQDLVAGGRTRGRLVQFHADHKYLLLAHGRRWYEELGRLVATGKDLRLGELYDEYLRLFTEAMAAPATPKSRVDVLMHLMGYFKRQLSPGEKQELLESMREYREGLVPLVVPMTLIRHYTRRFEVAYLERQAFLSPYPAELMLRNSV